MADPISAEPKNWENDILLKITMPGRELRESTILKMKRAEERRTHMIDPFSKPVQELPVIEKKPEPVQVQLTDVQKPVELSNPVVEEAKVEEQAITEEKTIIEEVQTKQGVITEASAEETVVTEEPVVQETVVNEQPKVEEVDILSKFVAGEKSPEQEWKEEMVRRTSENGVQKPKTDPSIAIAERRHEEKKPEFYTNYPGLEMKEKYKVWTIEPEKEEAPVVRAIHDSVNSSKVEGFANKIIGGDWAIERLKKR